MPAPAGGRIAAGERCGSRTQLAFQPPILPAQHCQFSAELVGIPWELVGASQCFPAAPWGLAACTSPVPTCLCRLTCQGALLLASGGKVAAQQSQARICQALLHPQLLLLLSTYLLLPDCSSLPALEGQWAESPGTCQALGMGAAAASAAPC